MNREYLKRLGYQLATPFFTMIKDPLPLLKWRRYRFKTLAEDYRPLIFDPHFPWWCSGHSVSYCVNDDSSEVVDSTIIAWLPFDEPLTEYWDDAFEVEFTEHEKIEFYDRFPRPEWFIES